MDDPRATRQNGAQTAEKLTREERLAAKLRENLRRRKAQARAVAAPPAAPLQDDPAKDRE
jgi:hypothetical protein